MAIFGIIRSFFFRLIFSIRYEKIQAAEHFPTDKISNIVSPCILENSMKNPFVKLLLTFLFLFMILQSSIAQERITQKPCFDSTLQRQAEEIKEGLSEKGFIVVREATMTMQSEYEMPVIAPLTAGTQYDIVFIGDKDSKLYEVRMFDWTERQVIYRKNGIENNVIGFSYIPKATEYHVIKPVQVSNIKKKKELCGYILMLKKVK